MRLNSPCYDPTTKTDCPRRCAGCAETCPEWEKYVEERDALYEKFRSEREANSVISHNSFNHQIKSCKKKMETRRNGRGKRYS